jgi:hypothetical protein
MATALTSLQRCTYGGIGALAPIFVAGTTIDKSIFLAFDLTTFLGWVFRTVCLFCIGAFVSFLHKKEVDEWRAFVIGISAPALITTAIAGPHPQSIALSQYPISISAFAAEAAPAPHIYPLCMPRRSVAIRFLNGILGNAANPLDLWWLTSAPLDSEQEALSVFTSYQNNSEGEALSPRIFVTSQTKYLVVLSLNLSAAAAQKSDPRLWKTQGLAPIAPVPLNVLLKSLDVSPDSLQTCHFAEP